jgi:hypothetical protein
MPSGVPSWMSATIESSSASKVSPRSAAASFQATPSPAPTAARQSWSPVWHDNTSPIPARLSRAGADRIRSMSSTTSSGTIAPT